MEDRVLFEDRVRADLRVFEAILDKQPEELVALLGKYQSGRPPAHRDTWYAWLNKPAQLSSVAYLKVVETIRDYQADASHAWPTAEPQNPGLAHRVAAIEPKKRLTRRQKT